MNDDRDDRIVFLDLETTGLDPKRDVILEIGIVVARIVALDSTYIEVLSKHSAVVYVPDVLERLADNPKVLQMHTDNGLLHEVADPRSASLEAVERTVLDVLRELCLPEGKTTLAGSSVWFDRGFLREHMPTLERFFFHRMLDVSAIRVVAELAVDPRIGERLRAIFGQVEHRAEHDCLGSIQELSLYLQTFLDPAGFWATTLSKVELQGDEL